MIYCGDTSGKRKLHSCIREITYAERTGSSQKRLINMEIRKIKNTARSISSGIFLLLWKHLFLIIRISRFYQCVRTIGMIANSNENRNNNDKTNCHVKIEIIVGSTLNVVSSVRMFCKDNKDPPTNMPSK